MNSFNIVSLLPQTLLWLFYLNKLLFLLGAIIWVGIGAWISWFLTHRFKRTELRWSFFSVLLFAYLMFPSSWQMALVEQARVLQAECQQLINHPVSPAATAPIEVEGFLDRTNYDGIVNDRFQKNADLVADSSGGSRTIDTGKYLSHPVLGSIPGRTFSAQAFELLYNQKFSYVEFEMLPEGKGEYSNAGSMSTSGWSGKKYRLFYLALKGDPFCSYVQLYGPGPYVEFDGRKLHIDDRANPVCMALAITDRPISGVQHVGHERNEWSAPLIRIHGVPVPWIRRMKHDRIAIETIDAGKVIREWRGFNYPNDSYPTLSCSNTAAVQGFFKSSLKAASTFEFLKSHQWYKGSAVQRFYEPGLGIPIPPLPPALELQPNRPECQGGGCASLPLGSGAIRAEPSGGAARATPAAPY